MHSAPSFFRQVRPGFIAALLLAWFWGQVISVSPELGITADEVIHLTAGYEYWLHGDYRLQPENGNLPQRVAALPLLWLRPSPVPATEIPVARADTWGIGNLFFFHLGNQPGLMIFLGRVMIALVGVATGALVYGWARDIWGAVGGLAATAFFCTSPNLLAHAGLVTSDMMASFGFVSALLAGWRLLHRVTVVRVLVFGATLAVLALSKFSAPLFVFVFAGMLAFRLGRRAPLILAGGRFARRLSGWRRLYALGPAVFLAALGAYAAIWSAYGFRYVATHDGQPAVFPIKWEILLGQTPFSIQTPVPAGFESEYAVEVQRNFVCRVMQWTQEHRLLPEAYLFGFAHVYTYSKSRPAFFLGEYRTRGWLAYFPVSVLLKTPLAILALVLLAVVLLSRLHRHTPRARRRWYRLAPLLIFAAVYLLPVLTGSLNIGLRHLLPVECALCVVGGVLAVAIKRRPLLAGSVMGAFFVCAAAATWSVRPGYLAFFNRLGGGPDQGYAYLVDSSLDWGQGLPRLARWLAQHRGRERVYLSYFGADSPFYENLRAVRTGDAYFNRERIVFQVRILPGIYAISATLLQGVYTMAPGPWTATLEQAYQTRLRQVLGENRGALSSEFWLEWDQLRFGRLRHFLLSRPPDAQPDPSILIYRLSAEDLSRALGYRVR